MQSAYDVIVKPILTEKSYDGIPSKKYVFEVNIHANKTEIKQAVETIFGVKVAKVSTLVNIGKMKRQGKTQGRRSDKKKAYVTLKADSKAIEFFEGMAQ